MSEELMEFKAFWKVLMHPTYEWLALPAADEKWADWSVMFLLGIIIVDLATM